MEARFAALEQRLLKDQEEKHAALVELLVKLHNPEDGGEVSCVHRSPLISFTRLTFR